jgi:hypothetical protein
MRLAKWRYLKIQIRRGQKKGFDEMQFHILEAMRSSLR